MMVNGISGNSSMQAMMPQPQSQQSSLTTEQSQLIEDTLAEFDVDNLSAADAKSIVETFSEAGIQPGSGLEQAMSDAGFDARTIGDLAGVGEGGGPPPPPQGGASMSQPLELDDELLSDLNEMLNEYYSGDLSDEEQTTMLSSIQSIIQSSAPEEGLLHITA